LSSIAESDIENCDGQDDEPIVQEVEIPVEVDAPRLEMGDHVFRRRAAGLAQVHAIVVSMAPGDDGPLLLADFTGQNVVGDDDDDDDADDNNNGVEEDNNGTQDEEKKRAAVEEEQPPDPTVERVRIICVEGRKNIRKWKKVRYGGSRFGGWFKRNNKKDKAETPKRSKSTVGDSSVSGDDTMSVSSSAPTTVSQASSATPMDAAEDSASEAKGESSSAAMDNNIDEEDEKKLPPQQQTPRSKSRNKTKDDDLPSTDPGTLVVERVNFLLENQNLIPPWHALKSNSECLAVWCKTGRWSTYQVSGYLNTIFMGQAKTAATVAAAASTATVSVPAAGYMGWLGFTTQVSLLALHPWLIPAIAGYGIASIGVPMYILKRCGKQWAKTTIDLNNEFWRQAPPDVFVDCIRKWSGLDDESE